MHVLRSGFALSFMHALRSGFALSLSLLAALRSAVSLEYCWTFFVVIRMLSKLC